MNTPPSVLISLDGIDGVGKTTQINELRSLLESTGRECLVTRDPGSTEIGLRLRSLLLESELKLHRRTEALLFMASRCEMVETVIQPSLASGKTVIADRFLLANVVYQSISNDGAGVSAETLWQMGNLANGGLRPDFTILLDMPAAAAVHRIKGPTDRMESRGIEYLELVRQSFLSQLSHASDQGVIIDASQEVDQVTRDIREAVSKFLNT